MTIAAQSFDDESIDIAGIDDASIQRRKPAGRFPNWPAVSLLALSLRCLGGETPPPAEPTREICTGAVDAARELAEGLPPGDLSRHFAERDLEQALTEANGGEFDECLEWANRAAEEVHHLYHSPQRQQ